MSRREVRRQEILSLLRKGKGTPQEIMAAMKGEVSDRDQRRRFLHGIRNHLNNAKKLGLVELRNGRWSVV